MKNTYFKISFVLAVSSLIGLSSCHFMPVKGSGNVVTANRKVADFTHLDISGGFNITLKQDSTLNVAITTDDNLLKYVKTDVSGNELTIKSRRKLSSTGDVKITIGVRNLEEIKASGGIKITSDGKLNTKDLTLDLSGSTNVTMVLNAANLNTKGTGATELYLTGQATSHTVDISGVAKLRAFDFIVSEYNLKTTGAGDCEINVLKSLNVSTTGASDIKYKGNPEHINNDKTGASTLEKIN